MKPKTIHIKTMFYKVSKNPGVRPQKAEKIFIHTR